MGTTKELKRVNTSTLPQHIVDWFDLRGIGYDTIKYNKISYESGWITIPVFNESGKVIFNKYRRDPETDSFSKRPKYKNQDGSSIALYGTHKDLTSPVIITEGELDALRLEESGVSSVSSTAGAGRWHKDFNKHIENKNVFICYDRDEAGFRGASIVQSFLPSAKIIILPKFDGKDITDYLLFHSIQEFFSLEAEQYKIPLDDSYPQSEKEVRVKIKEYKVALDDIVDKRHNAIIKKSDIAYIDWLNNYLLSRYENYKNMLNKRKIRSSYSGTIDIQSLKQIPISDFVDFGQDGFALCLWHNEKTPSMYYNEPGSSFSNTVKCFSCGVMYDVIDVVMAINEVDFRGAVEILKKHTI